MEYEKLISIGQYSQGVYAHVAKSRLEAEGIEAIIMDEHLIGANWFYSNALGGVKLQVKSTDVEKAIAILEEPPETIPEEILKKDKELQYCPTCGSEEINFETFNKIPALVSWIVLGFPLPFIKMKWKCHNCGYEWKK
ncbi:putative signal transducing protein [Candidatus Latescibacterota bacterium]